MPNPRVQRTRSSPSALREPLTRHPLGARELPGRMRVRVVGVVLMGVVVVGGARLLGQCSFPWTVTAPPTHDQSVAVTVCGLWSGCTPHNPRFAVADGQITVTFTAAELPDCGCSASEFEFTQTVVVSPVPNGTYGVTATVINCGQPRVVGTGSVTVGGASAIPTLDWWGVGALSILLVVVGIAGLKSGIAS